jgi:hypothetical protein
VWKTSAGATFGTTAKEADNMMETISVDKADADVTKQEVCYKEAPNLSLSLSLTYWEAKGLSFFVFFPKMIS